MMEFKWVTLVFAGLFVAIVAVDIWLVQTGRKSISWMTWLIERTHPTVIVGVTLIGMLLAWLLWDDFIVASIVLIATGHLITNDATLSAVSRYYRPARS